LHEGLARKDPKAVAALFDAHAAPVRRLLTRMLSDASEADDLTQETLLIVLRRAADIRHDGAIRAFVMSTAVRVAKNEIRKRALRRWVFFADDEPEVGPGVAAADSALRERVVRLQGALNTLGTEARALFLLRRLEGIELAELAATFGCSLATIKRRLAKVEKQFNALARADAVLADLVDEEAS
jgi:RNA polymerase sigma-70 factor, ECF subfamily